MARRVWLGIALLVSGHGLAHADPEPDSKPEAPYELLALAVETGFAYASMSYTDTGTYLPAGAVAVGVRVDSETNVGLRVNLMAPLKGIVPSDVPPTFHYSIVPVQIEGYAQREFYGRLWGAAMMGLELDHYADEGGSTWMSGLVIGIAGGVDVVRAGPYRFGIYGRVESELQSVSYIVGTFGITARR